MGAVLQGEKTQQEQYCRKVTQEEAIVLEVDVIHNEQPWVGDNEKEDYIAVLAAQPPAHIR